MLKMVKLFTFIKRSRSGSGLIFAYFSLLDSSTSISAYSRKSMLKITNLIATENVNNIFCGNLKRKQKLLTITRSDSLAFCRESQGFSHSHFSNMAIILTDIGSTPLGYEFMHSMPIVSHIPRKLKLQNIVHMVNTR